MEASGRATQTALATLPETVEAGVRIMAARALREPADVDDAVQETLARAVEALRLGRLPSGVPVGAYVAGIARHVIADALRRRGRFEPDPTRPLAELPSRRPSALEALVTREETRAVRWALDHLSAPDRQLLERLYMKGERIVDLAARTGQPAPRLRKRKSRALERLRQALAGAPRSPFRP